MTQQQHEATEDEHQELHTPNFELPRLDVIHEDNWAVWEAKGFCVAGPYEQVVDDDLAWKLNSAQNFFGTANTYTGDAWSDEANRPLRHMPGWGIYISPEGQEHAREQYLEWERERQAMSASPKPTDRDQQQAP